MSGRALTLILAFATALAQAATCYGVNGVEFPNQVICPGSSACCGETGTCMDNRLCHRPGDDQNLFVRGPCAEDPYDESKCAAVCAYNETTYGGNYYFPRVNRCADGSYCCSNDSACCATGGGVVLDGEGRIVDSTSSSSSSPSSTETSTTKTPSAEAPSTQDAAGPDSTAFKVGLGLGIPLAAIVAAFGVWFVLRKKLRAAAPPEDQKGTAGRKYLHPELGAYPDDSTLGGGELQGTANPVELGTEPVGAREG